MNETVSTSEIARLSIYFCRLGTISANFRVVCGLGHEDLRVFSDGVSAPYDQDDALYLDEADVRLEIARSFNVCRECRQCIDLCSVFPSAFSHVEEMSTPDAGMMTPHQQDRLIDACHECSLCTTRCPYAAGSASLENPDTALDVWQLMVRAKKMRHHHGLVPWRQRLASWARFRPHK